MVQIKVWIACTPDRKGIHLQTHLAKFKGVPQADAYACFNAFVRGWHDPRSCAPGVCAL
ncbi:IS66 family transposase [Duganella violaceipulchra]|uniref:Transposase IS66 central domain-containing protein n=1 Tax=Duganella violaceipulchra TaxID=2849652 RepID=A0ABT1GF56_9BURK|nr:IS66 family transposase [Duganella violaceicalia]MCP2007582.1 hypothetical protein [Duganella violaceicalia]